MCFSLLYKFSNREKSRIERNRRSSTKKKKNKKKVARNSRIVWTVEVRSKNRELVTQMNIWWPILPGWTWNKFIDTVRDTAAQK